MKTIGSVFTAAAVLLLGTTTIPAYAQHAHVTQSVQEAQWGPAPPFISGRCAARRVVWRPDQGGPVLCSPEISGELHDSAHSYPTDENVVVVTGAVTFGMGDKLMKTGAMNKTVSVGDVFLASAGMNHYATRHRGVDHRALRAKVRSSSYVNPADDPRNMKTTSR